jgi:hypothetical protein
VADAEDLLSRLRGRQERYREEGDRDGGDQRDQARELRAGRIEHGDVLPDDGECSRSRGSVDALPAALTIAQ